MAQGPGCVMPSGLEPWPKLFHNLRASRETELMRDYDLATVCKWIGNSPAVAAKHYAMCVDLDATFSGRPDGRKARGTESGTVHVDNEREEEGRAKGNKRKSPGCTERFRAIPMLA